MFGENVLPGQELSRHLVGMTSEEFLPFSDHDYVKVVWNFRFDLKREGELLISTETRIKCMSSKVKRRFSRYWFVVSYFSGIIRTEMLKIIKEQL